MKSSKRRRGKRGEETGLKLIQGGGEMSIHEKRGGGAKPCVHVHKH